MGRVAGYLPRTREAELIGALVRGDELAARAVCARDVVIDDPILGAVNGQEGIRRLAHDFEARFAADDVVIEFLSTVERGDRSAAEFEFQRLRNGRRVSFPGVIVADIADGLIEASRIYYRRVSIDDTVSYRRFPVLTAQRRGDEMHPTLVAYIAALARRDTDAVLDLFSPEGSFHLHRGRIELRRLFERMFTVRTDGVVLEHPNVFSDGRTTCLEFNSIRVHGEPGHAGVAFYEIGDDGLLAAVRPLDE